jgi:Tfp pilus assembly pilus retraction ATPase PilT
LNTPLASDLIRKGEVHKLKELMKKSNEQGMITFDQALFNLYQEGEISYEDALRYADSANEVRLVIKLPGVDRVRGNAHRAPRSHDRFRGIGDRSAGVRRTPAASAPGRYRGRLGRS